MNSPISDPAKAKTALAYNTASDHYQDDPLGFWDRAGQGTVVRVGLQPGARVLDVCCGAGASALLEAEAVGPEGQVVAVDLAQNLLALGRAQAEQRGLANIEFREGDMEALGYPDGEFDAVVCVFGIFFVSDMEKQVAELWRMVKPGGRLALTTWGPRFGVPMYPQWREAVKAERPDLYSAFNPWDRITDVDAVRRLMIDGGAAEPVVTPEPGEQPLRSADDWWRVVLGSGLRWTVDQMGPEAAERVRQQNAQFFVDNGVTAMECNFIYATATKPEG